MKILNLLKPALIGAAMLLSFACYGQGIYNNVLGGNLHDGTLSIPLGVLPMQYNSSFAGESKGGRLNTVFSFGYEDFAYAEQNLGFHASYDQFIPALRSGIGITVNKGSQRWLREGGDSEEFNAKTNSVSIAIAPKFSIKGKYTLSPSIDFSYGQGRVYANMPNENRFLDRSRGQHARIESRLGLLLNTSKYYIGFTAYPINAIYHNKERTSLHQSRYLSSLQAGYTFQKSADSKFSFTPQITYIFGVSSSPLNEDHYFHTGVFNFTLRYDDYIAGINQKGIHLGWQTEKLRLMVSGGDRLADMNIFSAGDLSLRYIFKD